MTERVPPIYVVSGGTGASGEQVVYTVLAQFPDNRVEVEVVAHVRLLAQLNDVIERCAHEGGTIVHTLTEEGLRDEMTRRADRQGVAAIDLMGPLLDRLTGLLQREPLGDPGLYRRLNRAYYERVAAIDYAMAHDDGKAPGGWSEAEIVLVGVSRVGKTPLSMYLAVMGWKAANVPLVPGIEPPSRLFELDPRRVVGLTMDPTRLAFHREQRRKHLGASGLEAYTDPTAIYGELEAAREVFRRGGFTTIDVTDNPIEASANVVADLMARRFGER
jgi:regulator of PEP synthase PpsR (kinase-PPPase family)